MARTVADVMTPMPVAVAADSDVKNAAQLMRDRDVGDVLVVDGDQVLGILTDRDVVVRAVARGLDPNATRVDEVCTRDLLAVDADGPIEEAVGLMRERAVRRLVVADDGQIVGIVSIGDLAMERDRDSALADISAAAPNN
jgi:CBS domain-containing protein